MPVENPGKKSYAVLSLALIIGFASWGQNADIQSWGQLTEFSHAIPLIGTLASVGMAWLGKSPVKQ